MTYITVLLLTFLSYFIGTLPIGWIIGKIFLGIDIREHGDGTITWRNVSSVAGAKTGAVVLAAEVSKGALASLLALWGCSEWAWFGELESYIFTLSFGLAAIAGQNFPLFNTANQSRDITCAIGVLLVLHPMATFICAIIAGALYLLFQYEHIGYAIAILFFPLLLIQFSDKFDFILPIVRIFAVTLAVTTIILHKSEAYSFMNEFSLRMIRQKISRRWRK